MSVLTVVDVCVGWAEEERSGSTMANRLMRADVHASQSTRAQWDEESRQSGRERVRESDIRYVHMHWQGEVRAVGETPYDGHSQD